MFRYTVISKLVMMKHAAKQTQNSGGLRQANYSNWLRAFESSLRVNTKAWKALQSYVAAEECFARVAEVPWKDNCRGHALETLHSMTSLQFDYDRTRKNNKETRRLLNSTLPQLKTLVAHLQRTGTTVMLDDGIALCDLSEVLKAYESLRQAADTLNRPYARAPQVINQCLAVLLRLSEVVPESQAVALTRQVMKAHGYGDGDLDCLSEDKVRAGHIRKRKKAVSKKFCTLIGLS